MELIIDDNLASAATLPTLPVSASGGLLSHTIGENICNIIKVKAQIKPVNVERKTRLLQRHKEII